jgi:AhpD family alkylhydroperoxidase
MTPRMTDHIALAPAAIKALHTLESTLRESSLGLDLLELVKLRASQINGCAFCLHMHATDAHARGAWMSPHPLAARLAGVDAVQRT